MRHLCLYNQGTIAIYRKAFLIFNPYAGGLRRRARSLDRAVEQLKSAGHAVETRPTTGPGTATFMARECVEDGADVVIVAGGDGTINEAMNGLVRTDVPLAILPGGTANVLAMEMGVPGRLAQAARDLCEWVPQPISVGLLRGSQGAPRHFLLMCGAGADAQIIYTLNTSLKAALGKAAYWMGGFSHFGRPFPEFSVEADGRCYRVSFALASRVRNYGGDLEIASSVSLREPHFELVLFSGTSSLKYLAYLAGILLRRVPQTRGITVLQTQEARFLAPENSRIHTQIDGEYTGRLPASIEIVPRAIRLLMPPAYIARRPLSVNTAEWTTSPTR